MIGSTAYVKAFERNCRCVRLSRDEREELRRLFFVCWGESETETKQELARRAALKATEGR